MAGDLAEAVPTGPTGYGASASRGPGRPELRRLRLLSFERNLSQVGVAELERSLGDIAPERLRAWFDGDRTMRELAVLRTCQRVLLLAVTSGSESIVPPGEGGWAVRSECEAIRYLFRISAGLDSRAPGEREVREQVRASASGVLSRHPRPILRPLLVAAANAAASTDPDGAGSVADLASDWLAPRLRDPRARVLVIGAGTVGRRAAERLAHSAEVTILYRQHAPDPAWLARARVRAGPVESLLDELARSDAVIAAAKTTGRVLRLSDLPQEPGAGPRWFIDLGLPRNIDPEIGIRPGVQLLDLEGLPRGRIEPGRLAHVSQMVEARAEDAARDFQLAAVEPWISELRGWAEDLRREEFERAREFAGDVPEAARVAFERFSERLVRRLLAGPTRELRELPPDPAMDLLRRRVVELFLPNDPGP
jgi:glutamyl-tRNA reductase